MSSIRVRRIVMAMVSAMPASHHPVMIPIVMGSAMLTTTARMTTIRVRRIVMAMGLAMPAIATKFSF
jgi:hypothetical protein